MGVRWYIIVLICLSLMSNDIGHLFMYLVATCVLSVPVLSWIACLSILEL